MAQSLVFNNCQLIWRDFGGTKNPYSNNKHTFGILIEDPAMAEKLSVEGLNIKPIQPKEEGDDLVWGLPVEARFDQYPPTIYRLQQTANGKMKRVRLNETNIAELDHARIISSDVVVYPYHYDYRGRVGVKALLTKMAVMIELDEFDAKYELMFEEDDDPEEIPFV